MDKIESIKQELLSQGKNPDDFNMEVLEGASIVSPKWSYQIREVAKQEDTPIIEDVNDIAEFSTITAMDKDEIAEMLVYALQRIDELEARLDG